MFFLFHIDMAYVKFSVTNFEADLCLRPGRNSSIDPFEREREREKDIQTNRICYNVRETNRLLGNTGEKSGFHFPHKEPAAYFLFPLGLHAVTALLSKAKLSPDVFHYVVLGEIWTVA